jgi:tetratricopeptide (TPR) repeat protein
MLALIKLDPESAVPAFVLRRMLADPAMRAAIASAYDGAAGADPDNESIARQRDLMLALGGDPKAYIARADAALAKKPDDAGQLNEACWARAMFKVDLETATSRCDKSLTIDRDASTLDSRGLVWLQRGDWAKAASDYGDALASRPRLASSLYGRGLARKRLGDAAGSKADFTAATRIDPRIAEAYGAYGLKP